MLYDFGFTPCPNDTFCFEQFVQDRVYPNKLKNRILDERESSRDLTIGNRSILQYGPVSDRSNPEAFSSSKTDSSTCLGINPCFHDVESLNRMALGRRLPVTKISAACFPKVAEHYTLLNSGAAFAFFGGPKLVSCRPMSLEEAYTKAIVVPGLHTTALKALELLTGKIDSKQVLSSPLILPALLSRQIEVALVIHEPLAISETGLFEILDIGREYQKKYFSLLPLGLIVARKDLGRRDITRLEEQMRHSVRIARQRATVTDFIRSHAPHLSDVVITQHIESYVGDETERLTGVGRLAIEQFCSRIEK